MFRRTVMSVVAATGLLWSTAGSMAESRMALVIGQSAYRAVTPLPNPSNDAKAMAQLLGEAGFEVTSASDLSQNAMRQTVSDFAAQVAAKGKDTVALVFYAGHGMQIDGENFLIPIDIDPTREAAIPLSASLLDKSEKLLDARLARDVKVIDGVKFALSRLRKPYCICSNSSSHRLDMMLSKVGLKEIFAPHIFSAKDLGPDRVKPKPDIFLHGAAQFGADPARTLVVEDSVHGITGARAAGMRVVGFTGASHSYPSHADRLTEAGAETVISRMSELPGVIAALAEWQEAI